MIKGSKASGWFLLIFGTGIILWSLYSSNQIFSGHRSAPEIFKVSTAQPSLPNKTKINNQAKGEAQIEKMLSEQVEKALPSGVFLGLLNLLSWAIFAGIMIFGGGQVATLGIRLIR